MNLSLRELRKKSGLTRRAVSIKTGLTEATIGNYEANRTTPSLVNAEKLASCYDCSVDVLLGRCAIEHESKEEV